MKLTPESVYQGLEGALTPEQMHDRLARHSPAVPAGVAEALRNWAGRRDRVTYHAAATLVEFASRADLEQALAHWPGDSLTGPVVVSERLLLVEDEPAIPFQRFRLTGSRDYRRGGGSRGEPVSRNRWKGIADSSSTSRSRSETTTGPVRESPGQCARA